MRQSTSKRPRRWRALMLMAARRRAAHADCASSRRRASRLISRVQTRHGAQCAIYAIWREKRRFQAGGAERQIPAVRQHDAKAGAACRLMLLPPDAFIYARDSAQQHGAAPFFSPRQRAVFQRQRHAILPMPSPTLFLRRHTTPLNAACGDDMRPLSRALSAERLFSRAFFADTISAAATMLRHFLPSPRENKEWCLRHAADS